MTSGLPVKSCFAADRQAVRRRMIPRRNVVVKWWELVTLRGFRQPSSARATWLWARRNLGRLGCSSRSAEQAMRENGVELERCTDQVSTQPLAPCRLL